MDPILGISSIFNSPISFNPIVNNNNGVSPALQVELARLDAVSQLFEPTSTLPGFTGVVSSTTVELSSLGTLLSALDTFQTNIEAVQLATATTAGQPATLASVTAAAQDFVQAFNGLAGTVNTLTATFTGALNGDFTATQLADRLNGFANQLFNVNAINTTVANITNPVNNTATITTAANTNATTTTGTAPLTTLAQIGLNFQPSTTLGAVGTFTVNTATLQTAFNANPAGTISLVDQATQALTQQLAGFTGPGGMLPGVMQSLQWGTIFGPGLVNGVNNLQGGGLGAQELMAIQQYARIAALAAMASFVGGESSKGLFA